MTLLCSLSLEYWRSLTDMFGLFFHSSSMTRRLFGELECPAAAFYIIIRCLWSKDFVYFCFSIRWESLVLVLMYAGYILVMKWVILKASHHWPWRLWSHNMLIQSKLTWSCKSEVPFLKSSFFTWSHTNSKHYDPIVQSRLPFSFLVSQWCIMGEVNGLYRLMMQIPIRTSPHDS